MEPKQIEIDKAKIKRDSKWDILNQHQPQVAHLEDRNACLSNKYRILCGDYKHKHIEFQSLKNHVASLQSEVQQSIDNSESENQIHNDMIYELKKQNLAKKDNELFIEKLGMKM